MTAANESGAAPSDRPLLSVVMPVYDEARTLRTIVERVREVPLDLEIVAVDDGSTDGSRDILRELESERFVVVFHEENTGKAGAIRTGFARARGEIVVIQDADLEYDPREFPKLLAPIFEGRADVVFGSRFVSGQARVHLFWHYVANRLLTLLSNLCTNLNLTDMECCYKAFRREVLDAFEIQSRRFALEPELVQKVAKLGVRVYEVGVSYHGRDLSEGKKIRLIDAFEAVWAILWFKIVWRPRRKPAISHRAPIPPRR